MPRGIYPFSKFASSVYSRWAASASQGGREGQCAVWYCSQVFSKASRDFLNQMLLFRAVNEFPWLLSGPISRDIAILWHIAILHVAHNALSGTPVAIPPLVLSFIKAHLCDTPFCNIYRAIIVRHPNWNKHDKNSAILSLQVSRDMKSIAVRPLSMSFHSGLGLSGPDRTMEVAIVNAKILIARIGGAQEEDRWAIGKPERMAIGHLKTALSEGVLANEASVISCHRGSATAIGGALKDRGQDKNS